MKTAVSVVAVATALFTVPASAQDVNVCQAQETALTNLESEFAEDQEHIKKEASDLEGETPANLKISGEVKFETTKTALDLPEVTMKDRSFSFKSPQVTMKQRKFAWSVPVVTMENKKIGEYPTTTCNWHGCTVKWKDIITKVPVTKMERREASTDVPEVTMKSMSFKTAVPEVKMVRKDMIYKLPHITVADPIPDYGPVEAKSKDIQADSDKLNGKMQARAAELTTALFTCHQDSLVEQRTAAVASFEDALKKLNATIDFVRAQDADPTKFQPSEAGAQPINLVAQRDQLLADRDKVIAQIDAAIAELGKSGKSIETAAGVV